MRGYIEKYPGYKGEPCHIWQGEIKDSRAGEQYGIVRAKGKKYKAHIFFWEKENGPLREWAEAHGVPDPTLDHLCRETLCCNPLHLDPCSRKENSRRAGESRRSERTSGLKSSSKITLDERRRRV